MRKRTCSLLALLLAFAGQAAAQASVERSPNVQGVWGLEPAAAIFVLSHRFEVMEGGDELISIPTLTLGIGLPLGVAAGVDFTSFSEVVPATLTGNEAQLWLKRPFAFGVVETALIGGYNTAAESWDGAVDVAVPAGRFRLFAEGRAFSSLFGSGDAGAAAAVGGGIRLTQFLGLTADVGKVLTEDDIPAAWSSALVLEIPSSPHTLSLVLTNTGATTLHGASREKVLGDQDVRYGFTFTVPLGGRGRWGRIFEPAE